MKKLNVIRCIFLILMLLVPFFASVRAQNCDPNILKALEQTRVTAFDKVTKGEIGSLFIKYPMKGVTYTFTDQAGTSYSYTHSGGSNSADVSVGVVNTERKFALKAVMGDCVYQTSFIYKLTPVTTLGIAVRVEHEWCNFAGALYYKIVGGDTSKYDFYHRLQGGAYAGLSSPVGGVTTLTSGTYEVKAEPKAGAPAVAPVSGLQIRSLDQTVDYTLTDLPSKCTGQLPGLRVNVTSGSYPLLFSLYDNTGTTPVPGFYRQTSNVFTNVPPGNYKVKVEDFCAISGGAATTKPHVVPNTMIDFTETYLNTIQEYGCDYLSFSQLGIKGDNLRAAFEAGSLPFPFTLKFELKEPAPSTIVHTVSRTFNNQNDVSLFLYAHPYVTNLLLVKENLRGERIPKKAGQWEIKAIVSACGVNKTLTAKTVTFKSLFNDFAVYEGGASETTACHSTNIVLSNTTRMDMSLDIYVVVDQAPAGFKYEEAGFFKLTTSNPLLHNKYVKKIQYYGAANDAYPIVAPEFINQGDQFKFRVVDAECDPNRNSGELPLTITHPTNNEPTDLWIHNTQSCRGVTSTGAPYGTFLFSRTRGSEITEIKILSFDGNPSDLPFTLPYTLPTSNRIDSKTWALYDLPAGKYDISVTNRCGNTKVWPNQKLFGETFSFTWSEGCTPSLNAIIGQPELRAYQSYSVNYFVQHFENGEWKDVERINLNASALSTSYNKTFTETRLKEGKFRVLRKIKYGDNGKICDIVVSEKEYIGDLKNPTAIGAGCPNGKYHIAIIANGGTPPYTYEWVSTTPVGSTTPVPSGHPAQTNDNFFVDLTNSDPNTTYTFAVTDACGNRRTVDTSLAGVATPEIKVDAGENAFYCTGQQATLSLPNIKGITVKWYRSDAPSTILGTGNSLTITVAPDDFVTGNTYKVELEMPARPDVASCISAAINNNFAYQFKSKNFVTPIPPTRKDITICAENNTTQDLTQLFQNIPTLSPGVTATIREKTGAIYVPDNNTITIGNMKGEYTFVYTLYEPCRKVIGTPVEATLTVNRKINPNTKPNIKICDSSITMDVLKSLVLAGSPEVASLALDFHWYQNNTDAQNQQNESAGSYAISLSPGQKKTVYVRYSKLGYCSGEPKLVEVEREATVAPKALTNPDCSVTTVRTLKALVDPVDSANVIIYKNGTELGDDMLIEEYTPTMYTYSKRLYQCTPPAQPLTFSYKERTAAAPQQVGVCTFRGYQNAPYVKVADIKSKIQVQYVGKTIRIYQNSSELSAANAAVNFTATDVYFTVEESGKCPSLQQKVTLQQAPFSVATPLPTLSICGDTTIAELKAEIGAQGLSNVKIYSSSLATEESDDKFVVWGNPYYYRVVETGKCPSDFIPLAFTNKGNKTNATPKLYEVCIPQGNTAKIADLKSVITGGEVKIFKRNNDNTWSDPLDDNTTANENDAYFYTLRETGKCPSDKTAISLVISYKTTTPTAPADPMWCSGKKVSDLKSYITSKGVTGTIKIYESATATTDLADVTVLEKNKSYHFTTHDGNPQHCESNRVALTVTIYASPAITTHPATPSTPPCGGSRPTLSVVATGDDISYQWYKNTTNDNTSGDIIPGKTSATFEPPTNTVGTTYYYVKVSSGKGCAAAVSNTAKIEVTKPTKITRQPTNIRHCMGTFPPPNRLEVDAEGTGTLTYQWYLKNNNYPSGTTVPNVPGNTGQDFFYNPPIDSPHTTTYYVEVTSDCGTEKSDDIVVDIIPYPSFKSGGNLTTNDNATYCKGATSVRKLKVDVQQGAGGPVYQWYKATTPTERGEAIDRAWSNEYEPDVSEAGIFYYYVTVRNQQYCTEELTSNRAKITVTKPTKITANLDDTTEVKYCKDATNAAALSVTAEGTGNFTYTWHKVDAATSVDSVVKTRANVTDNQDTYTPLTTEEGTFYYYVVVHSDCGADKTSKRAKITINKPTGFKQPNGNLDDTTEVKYCENATDALTIKVEGTAPYTYKWYKADNATDAGEEVRTQTNSNSNQDSYTPTTVGTAYYYVKITGHCGAEVTSNRAKITITKVTAITANLSPAEVKYCKGATNVAKLTVTAEGTPTIGYKWYKARNATDAGTEILGAITREYTPLTTEEGTSYYYVVVHSDCGSDVTSARAKVTITDPDTPTVSDQTFCNAATVADLRPNDSDIKWYASLTGGAPLTDGTRALAHGNKYYAARTLGSCESARAEVTVTIISLAKPIVTEDTAAACGQANVLTITTGFDTDATYTFAKEDDTPVSGGSVEGANHKITGLDPGRYRVIATKRSCTQKSDVFEVKAPLRAPDIPDLEFVRASCGVITKAKVENHVADQTYWYNGTRIDYDTASHELNLAPGNYTIIAKSTNGCESTASIPFVIEAAKPKPVAPVVSLTPETCEKRTVAKVENHVAGQTYWYNGTEIHYDTASHELTLDPGSYTIIAKNTAGCESEASNIVIKNNKPTTRIVTDPQDPLDKTYQLGERANELRVTINGTALSYKWFRNTSRDYSGADVAEVARTETYVPPTNKVGIFYYWLEITAECGGDNEGKTRSGIAKIEVIDQRKAIRAIDDNFGKISNTANTTTTQSIFSSGVDTMEGVLGVLTTNEVDIHYGELKHNGTVLTQPDANITLNGNGTLSVKQNTPEGQYEYTYKLCEKGRTDNCSNEATVKFEVTATRIIANDDGEWEVGRTGGLLPNVLDNDVLGGQIGLTISDVIIERNAAEAAPDPKISIETDGRVSVKPGLAPGEYTYHYTIKERANVANVDYAKVKIKVVNFAAVGDEFELINTPTVEQKTGSVLANDELNGTKNLSENPNVVLTPGDRSLNTLIMNPDDGTITIAPGTPNGTYRYNYRICTLRPAECREAQAVIKLYTVIAKEDDYSSTPVNTTLEAKTIGNVLENDEYPEKPNYSKVDLSVVGNSHDIELKPNGDVVVPQGMPAGNYVIRYRLCIAGQTNSCQEANIKIVVFQDKPLTIYNGISADGDGHNDYFHIESIERYPVNNLKIFNRWGVLVYEKDGYRNDTEPFDGHSNGRATISAGSKLPQGTYYYILEYQDSVGQTQKNQGWLYLKY